MLLGEIFKGLWLQRKAQVFFPFFLTQHIHILQAIYPLLLTLILTSLSLIPFLSLHLSLKATQDQINQGKKKPVRSRWGNNQYRVKHLAQGCPYVETERLQITINKCHYWDFLLASSLLSSALCFLRRCKTWNAPLSPSLPLIHVFFTFIFLSNIQHLLTVIQLHRLCFRRATSLCPSILFLLLLLQPSCPT